MADDVRLSEPTLRTLRYLLCDATKPRSGADLMKATKLGSGTMYPLLARLDAAGWIEGQWEEIDPREAARPRRRLYVLTMAGRARARSVFSQLNVPPDVEKALAKGGLAWNS